MSADGTCEYNGEACAPDDPRLLALIAQVAPVEVRPAARAPHPPPAAHSPPSNRPMDRPARFAPAGTGEGHGHRGAHPRRTPSLSVARHDPTAATRKARPRSDVCTRPSCRRGRRGGTLLHPNNRRLVHTKRSLPCHSPAHRLLNAATRSGLCSLRIPFWFGRPRKPWPTCRCAWRCACTAATKFGGVL